MLNRLSIFALFFVLPLAACEEDTATTVEGDTIEPAIVEPAPVMPDTMMAEPMDVTAQATLDAVPAEGLTAMAPAAAVANIDAWIAKLGGIPEASGVVTGLETLKAQLQASPLDGAAIGQTLMSLGEQTTAAAAGDTALEQLGSALSGAGSTLAGM